MLFRSSKTVRATTKREVDEALRTAQRVVVEGDDALLTYAVAQASGNPDTQIDVEIAKPEVTVSVEPVWRDAALGPGDGIWGSAPDPTKRPRPSSGPQPPRGPVAQKIIKLRSPVLPRLMIGIAVVLVVLVSLLEVAQLAKPRQGQLAPSPIYAPSSPNPGRLAGGPNSSPRHFPHEHAEADPQSPRFATAAPAPEPDLDVQEAPIVALAWPAVAMVAIIAMSLLAWVAIRQGSNVRFEWKITEKVSGRLVITKVRQPAKRRPKAQPA